MIVKPQTFKNTGRYPTAASRAEYLTRDGRTEELATYNITDEERWYNEMDKTTEQYHLRGSVVGREYILSPSPDDHVTPSQMRDFAYEWVAKNFQNSEAAIIVHYDNKERLATGKEPISHAHVYINAPDLETGKKIQINNARVRELHDSAQKMCAERGWSTQAEYWNEKEGKVRHLESQRSAFERRPQWERSARVAQEAKICAEVGKDKQAAKQQASAEKIREFEKSKVAAAGIDYYEYRSVKSGCEFDKTQIRRSVKEAAEEVKRNPHTTMNAELKKRGVVMEKASDGDYKYHFNGRGRSYKGKTLGARYARPALHASIQAGRGLARLCEQSMEAGS